MAQIDKLLETMTRRSASHARLAGDQPIILSISGNEVQGAAISNAQLCNVLTEILNPNPLPPPDEQCRAIFHSSPQGRFRITYQRQKDQKWLLCIDPTSPPSYVRSDASATSTELQDSESPHSAASSSIQGELTLLTTLNERDKQVLSVALTNDGTRLATGLIDSQVNVWNLKTGKVERTINHGGLVGAAFKNLKTADSVSSTTQNGVRALAFSADGDILATLSRRKVKLWKWPDGEIIQALKSFSDIGSNHSLALSPNGAMLASTNLHGVLQLWNIERRKLNFALGHQWMLLGLPISVMTLLAGCPTKLINLYMGQTAIAFSSDGRRVASAYYREIRVWDIETGKMQRSMTDGDESLLGPFFPYLRMKASSSLQGSLARIECLAFSPDGQTLATGSWSKDGANLLLWNIDSNRKRALDGHTDTVNAVVFSIDGRFLISGGKEGELKIWHVETGNLVRTVKAHRGSINSIALSHDGRTIATGSDDKNVKLWLLQ
jgi:WD40 repeat protein